MVYKGLVLVLVLFCVFGMVNKVESHGSGPPFLVINDKYAQSNLSLISADPRFIAGMDFSPDPKYLVNKPIIFRIDAEKILLPEEQKKVLEYRWQWDKNATQYGTGLEQTHTYTTVGSHLITLEAKPQDVAGYTIIDSVKMDIVKDLNYVLPSAKIVFDRQITDTENIISLSADIIKDPSSDIASYTWKLDEGVYSDASKLIHRYARGSYAKQITLEIVDSQGFYAYAYYTFTDAPEMQPTIEPASQKLTWPYYLVAGVIGLPSALLLVLFIWKRYL